MSLPEPYYDDGQCTIFCGEAGAVLASMPPATFDVVLTDPPYSSGGMYRGDRAADPADKYRGWSQNTDGSSRAPTATYGTFGGDNRDQWSWIRWVSAWSWSTLRVTKPGGHAFMFSDWRQLPAATDALQFGGWTWQSLIVWDKGVGRPMKGRFRNHLEYIVWATSGGVGDRTEEYPSTLISVPTVGPNERVHVTQKPTALLEQLLRVVSDSEGLVVLDPFMGSGSTLEAAKRLGHRVVGIEVDERYCEAAVKRLAQGAFDFGGAA